MDPAASKQAGKQRASISPTSTTGQKIQPFQPQPSHLQPIQPRSSQPQPSQTKSSQPQPSQTKSSQPKPSQPQPSQPKPSQHPPSPYALTAVLPTAGPSHQDRAQSQNSSKVAIPRLNRNSGDQSPTKGSAAADRNRVAHACEQCRQRKTKCSGERPRCQHCEDLKLHCAYADGKRDKARKQLGSLALRLEEYEQLLEELSLRAGEQDQALIRRTLDREQSSEDVDESVTSSSKKSGSCREPAGEYKASARAGSTESLDCIEEDYNRNQAARATGYHGKNSELTWMQELRQPTAQDSEEDQDTDHEHEHEDWRTDGHTSPTFRNDNPGPAFTPISEANYHCDDLTLDPPGHVNMFELPLQATADMLFQSYLETVHPAFPIIGKTTFTYQYQAFLVSRDQSRINRNWLAILNLIFAIGAKYSHLIQAEWSGDKTDHLVYFARARMLGFSTDAILGHAELQKIQIAGLVSFYLMAMNQINRAWATSGVAIRHATTLGLNLRNNSKDVSETSKEIRYRVWWSLCSLERILSVMTGRPTSFSETDCSAPAPLPFEEDSFSGNKHSPQNLVLSRRLSSQSSRQTDSAISTSSSSGYSSKLKMSPVGTKSPASQEKKQVIPPCNALYFTYHTALSNFSNEVLQRLYRADAMSMSWADVQSTIATLNLKLEKWRTELPNVFDFTKKQRDQQFVRQRMSLGFFYYSTVIIINRPCLCRIDRNIPNQSGKAQDFNRETAMKCVHAPLDMLHMLPQQPNAVGLYTVAPWWCLVHFFVQAATVLMLELSLRSYHMPNEVEGIFDSAKKALDWLRSLSQEDEAAKRAWSLCSEALRNVAPKVGRSLAKVSDYGDHQGHAADQAQGMEANRFTQEPVTTSTYLPQNDYASFPQFDPPIFSYYDRYLPYSHGSPTSASGLYNDMFPTALDMDGMHYDGQDRAEYFNEDNQRRWFPGPGLGGLGSG